MQSDPLQQLRDIHLPADPSWWPPAIGWWLLAIAIVAGAIWGVRYLVRAWQQRAAIRAARRIHQQLSGQLQRAEIDPLQYANECNALLKRLLVRAHRRADLAALTDTEWLQALDRIGGNSLFTNSGASSLGLGRFAAEPQIDAQAIDAAVARLLKRVKPAALLKAQT